MGRKLARREFLQIRGNIVKKLYSHEAFNKGHLLFETLQHGIPSHLTGFTNAVLDSLLKEEIVLRYGKTKHGDAYQLNIRKLKEIEDIISYADSKRL